MPNLLEQAITSDDADQTATSIMTVNPSSEDLCGNCFTPLPETGGPCPKSLSGHFRPDYKVF